MQFLKTNESYRSARIHSEAASMSSWIRNGIPELNRQLVNAGFNVNALVPQRTLETYFLNLIEGHEGADNP